MKLPRRKFLRLAGAAAVAPTFLRVATAQTYPSRSITMIVPFPAGGAYDTIGRIIAEPMRASLGQPIIIENVGGADGSIGVGRAARATPDGYTIVVGGLSVHVLNGALYSLPYDVVNDFTPISPLAGGAWVLFSRKGFPANDLPELIEWLKAHPDMASAAVELASVHLVTASFQKQTGTRFALVPYRGAAPAIQDLVAGHIDLFFDTPLQIPLVRAGSIKAFAVTNDVRLTVAPNIPTFAEMGLPGVSSSGWLALFAPKGTPSDIIGKLNAAAAGALADPVARSRIADLGMDIVPRERQTPEALAALVKADAAKWWPLIKEFGIKAK
jgi:tripartite-type tricarboxylate transporter receptor subunit TctC